VYKVTPSSQVKNSGDVLEFEDENCKVSYNFWKEGGNVGFLFTNKTGVNLYLDMTESFFILNGIANDYYKDRTFSHAEASAKSAASAHFVNGASKWYSVSLGVTAVKALSGSSSVSTHEQKIICIPPKTSKIITEYDVTNAVYRDCDLFRYPRNGQNRSKSFTETDTPLRFSNLLAYYIGESEEPIRIENNFYVSEISNYLEKEITEKKNEVFCGKEKRNPPIILVFKNASPDKFYIGYRKDIDEYKH
jgi:hypothetical protein